MVANEIVLQLHDKATRGGKLSAEEQAALEAWYAQQDEEQGIILNHLPPSPDLGALRAELNQARAELHAVTQEILALMAANDGLRKEIAELQRRLAQQDVA